MKKTIKLISIITAILTMFTLFAFYSSAETNLNMSATSFSKKWEYTTHFYISVSGNQLTEIGTMIWGYNTFAFNEDYCRTRGWEHNKSTAKLKRIGHDSDYISGTTAATTFLSSIEKIHKTDNVSFRITLSGDYSNHEITKTTVS